MGKRDVAGLKALELLGKSVGMFDQSRQHPQQHLHLHGELKPEERQRLLRMRRRPTVEGEHRPTEG